MDRNKINQIALDVGLIPNQYIYPFAEALLTHHASDSDETTRNLEDMYHREREKVKALQKRIDDALERSNHACIGIPMFFRQFEDVCNILRGRHES